MAAPLPSRKQSVSLTAPGVPGAKIVRGSRIRRDPPPAVKQLEVVDIEQRDTRTVVIGILTFTLALVIILLAIASYSGWSPRDYVAHF